MCREGVVPRVPVRHVVDGSIHAELLPHEARVVVGDRPVPVVRVAERCPGLDVAILPRPGAVDDGPAAAPARCLARCREGLAVAAARVEGAARRAGERAVVVVPEALAACAAEICAVTLLAGV